LVKLKSTLKMLRTLRFVSHKYVFIILLISLHLALLIDQVMK